MKGMFILIGLIALLGSQAGAKTIIVNTTNNVSPAIGETNLVQAINLLQDGDTIAFNLPGPGPFYLITPPLSPDNGYPAITNNNVTINGYTQPGALMNTNTILGSNTAQIQIVLDSRAGGMRVEDIPGYSLDEASVLLVKGATNVTIRGLDFLGPGIGSGVEGDPATYAISFALGSANGHVSGCWFGVAPDRTNVFRFQDAVTGFQGVGESFPDGIVIGVAKNAPDAAAARSQFNVTVGEYIPLALEGRSQRISGNFINVFPDGVTDYNIDDSGDHTLQAFIEIGRSGDNLVIGTDGDGRNDAEERNIFGGVTLCDDFNQLEWYGCTSTNTVVAGNYFGVGVDGVTRFTNSMTLLGGLHGSTTMQFGSDFDGVDDNFEGNVISMNHPFDKLFPSPTTEVPYDFSYVQTGAAISFRGNQLLGAELMPFTYADGYGDELAGLADYCSNYLAAPFFPVLDTNSTQTLFKGTFAPGVAPFTNVVIDIYLADEEAWTNGQKFHFEELAYADPVTSATDYDGFSEGRTWLASFAVNSPVNLDSTPGHFAIRGFYFPANQLLTVSASYSASPPALHNAVTHTGPFALPISLPMQVPPPLSIILSGTNLLIAWPTNAVGYYIQSTPAIHPPNWADLMPQPLGQTIGTNYQVKINFDGNTRFFRLAR